MGCITRAGHGVAPALGMLAAAGSAWAGDRGDRVDRRMDHWGERIDLRLVRRERLDLRWDRRQ